MKEAEPIRRGSTGSDHCPPLSDEIFLLPFIPPKRYPPLSPRSVDTEATVREREREREGGRGRWVSSGRGGRTRLFSGSAVSSMWLHAGPRRGKGADGSPPPMRGQRQDHEDADGVGGVDANANALRGVGGRSSMKTYERLKTLTKRYSLSFPLSALMDRARPATSASASSRARARAGSGTGAVAGTSVGGGGHRLASPGSTCTQTARSRMARRLPSPASRLMLPPPFPSFVQLVQRLKVLCYMPKHSVLPVQVIDVVAQRHEELAPTPPLCIVTLQGRRHRHRPTVTVLQAWNGSGGKCRDDDDDPMYDQIHFQPVPVALGSPICAGKSFDTNYTWMINPVQSRNNPPSNVQSVQRSCKQGFHK